MQITTSFQICRMLSPQFLGRVSLAILHCNRRTAKASSGSFDHRLRRKRRAWKSEGPLLSCNVAYGSQVMVRQQESRHAESGDRLHTLCFGQPYEDSSRVSPLSCSLDRDTGVCERQTAFVFIYSQQPEQQFQEGAPSPLRARCTTVANDMTTGRWHRIPDSDIEQVATPFDNVLNTFHLENVTFKWSR